MRGVIRSLMVSLWFMLLTFPLLVLRISPLDGGIELRWKNMIILGISIFVLSFVWRALLVVKGISTRADADMDWLFTFLSSERNRDYAVAGATGLLALGGLWLALGGSTSVTARLRCPGIGALVGTTAVAFITARR